MQRTSCAVSLRGFLSRIITLPRPEQGVTLSSDGFRRLSLCLYIYKSLTAACLSCCRLSRGLFQQLFSCTRFTCFSSEHIGSSIHLRANSYNSSASIRTSVVGREMCRAGKAIGERLTQTNIIYLGQ